LKLSYPLAGLDKLPLGQSGVVQGVQRRIQGFDFEGDLPFLAGARRRGAETMGRKALQGEF
jgi:hypothetical protein